MKRNSFIMIPAIPVSGVAWNALVRRVSRQKNPRPTTFGMSLAMANTAAWGARMFSVTVMVVMGKAYQAMDQ